MDQHYRQQIDNYLRHSGFRRFEPRAVLFDMDGVIYDSMPNHAYSWHEAMAHFGVDMSPEEAYEHEGMRGVETIKKIVKARNGVDISDEVAARMYREKSRLFVMQPQAAIMPGIVGLQRKIKAAGLKIVVVTGSGQSTLLNKLYDDFKGLVERELVVSSSDVSIGKPHPMPYLKGMEKAGVEPWQAIVVENAPLGVRAAKAANIFTIAVNTGPLPHQRLIDEGADIVFSKMTELERHIDHFIL